MKIINKILNNLNIKQGSNIYLSVDLMKVATLHSMHNKNLEQFSIKLLKFILKKIGPKGTLIVPVFNYDCIRTGEFDRKKSIGQSGAFGNFLLKKNYLHRSYHPFTSFLVFGNLENKMIELKYDHSESNLSLWNEILKNKFQLITLGHHYQRAFTIIHYIEKLSKVNYRYDKMFFVNYKNFDNKNEKKKFYFFARKTKNCKHSSITFKFDEYVKKNKISKIYITNNLINFKIDLKKSCKIIENSLKNRKENFVSYARNTDSNKNKHMIYGLHLLAEEQKYIN